MFSNQSYLDRKTGADGFGRHAYLKQLMTEYRSTANLDCKKEVLANLANFSYDPINYSNLRKLQVPLLFVDCLNEEEADLVEFAASGLCNLAADQDCAKDIDRAGGIAGMISQLASSREATVLSAVTCLYYLAFSHDMRKRIGEPAVLACIDEFARCKNARLRNVALVFLDHFSGLSPK